MEGLNLSLWESACSRWKRWWTAKLKSWNIKLYRNGENLEIPPVYMASAVIMSLAEGETDHQVKTGSQWTF